ncbi:hypothetical protein L596_009202 [Steinernema carpocapsae]|uniref:Uncharacterized protein n=1 Tax=Steinernema carpocapsae TaxID=34508 RepID=A0A4U5PEN3_STECR|nr:hypothetical protein L596_009202 [Steinernema carpocapsae]
MGFLDHPVVQDGPKKGLARQPTCRSLARQSGVITSSFARNDWSVSLTNNMKPTGKNPCAPSEWGFPVWPAVRSAEDVVWPEPELSGQPFY